MLTQAEREQVDDQLAVGGRSLYAEVKTATRTADRPAATAGPVPAGKGGAISATVSLAARWPRSRLRVDLDHAVEIRERLCIACDRSAC